MTVQNVELSIPGSTVPWTLANAYTPDGDYANVNAMKEGIALAAQNMINKWLDINTLSAKVVQNSEQLQALNGLVQNMKSWDGLFPTHGELAAVAVAGLIPPNTLWVNVEHNPTNSQVVDASIIKQLPPNYPNGDPLQTNTIYQRVDGSLFVIFPTSSSTFTEDDVILDSSTLLQGSSARRSPPATAAYIAQLVPTWQENADNRAKSLTQVSQTNQTVLQQLMARYEQWNQLVTNLITRMEKSLMDLARNIG